MLSPEDRREFREYAWNYFAIHADHRLKVFNFYLVLASLVIGALVTVSGKGGLNPNHSLLLLLLAFLSFIFWKFEERARMLVKNGEAALKYLDREVVNPEESPLALFEQDDIKTNALPKWPLSIGYYSYSRVFRWVYAFFGFGSAIIFIAIRLVA